MYRRLVNAEEWPDYGCSSGGQDYGSSYAFGCDGVEDRHSVPSLTFSRPHDPTRIKVWVCPSMAGDYLPRNCMYVRDRCKRLGREMMRAFVA